MFEGFVRLSDASDERITTYARKWGALRISPIDSNSGTLLTPQGDYTNLFEQNHGCKESIAEWRAQSQKVRTLLLQAARLEKLMARWAGRGDLLREERQQISSLALDIQAQINLMIFANAVRPYIGWGGEEWATRLHFDNLGGAIYLQLMLLIARKEGIALCSCGEIFFVDRKHRKYCEHCGLAGARRAASKKRYRAKRNAQLMHEQGKSDRQIAEALERPLRRVKGWLAPLQAK